jgi:hypothetical protein
MIRPYDSDHPRIPCRILGMQAICDKRAICVKTAFEGNYPVLSHPIHNARVFQR